jgi:CubicO group peptidase (beta-lactamase class C family)
MRPRQFVVGLLAIAVTGVSLRATARDAQSAKVDAAVEAQRKAQKIPGVSLVVCRNGKIVKAGGYGLANVELDVPVTP